MASGEDRIDELGEIEFHGQVGKRIAQYARTTQRLGHDLAYTLDNDAERARKAMLHLRKHPLLRGLDVRVRAWHVSRRLRRARDLARGISAEAVKYHAEYRKQFPAGVDTSKTREKRTGEVDI